MGSAKSVNFLWYGTIASIAKVFFHITSFNFPSDFVSGSYTSDETHRASCKAKCSKCWHMGGYNICNCLLNDCNFVLGWEGPCKPDKEVLYSVVCAGCNKNFTNRQCYQRHIDQGICNLFKRCIECGCTYRVENKVDSNGIKRTVKHVCDMKVCVYKVFLLKITLKLSGAICSLVP